MMKAVKPYQQIGVQALIILLFLAGVYTVLTATQETGATSINLEANIDQAVPDTTPDDSTVEIQISDPDQDGTADTVGGSMDPPPDITPDNNMTTTPDNNQDSYGVVPGSGSVKLSVLVRMTKLVITNAYWIDQYRGWVPMGYPQTPFNPSAELGGRLDGYCSPYQSPNGWKIETFYEKRFDILSWLQPASNVKNVPKAVYICLKIDIVEADPTLLSNGAKIKIKMYDVVSNPQTLKRMTMAADGFNIIWKVPNAHDVQFKIAFTMEFYDNEAGIWKEYRFNEGLEITVKWWRAQRFTTSIQGQDPYSWCIDNYSQHVGKLGSPWQTMEDLENYCRNKFAANQQLIELYRIHTSTGARKIVVDWSRASVQ